jgi:glycosyltransferase involved in cell wall biosynthesis
MKYTPTISIIIPCYNAAETLAATLDSALAQTFRHFELLIINDGSSDDSEKIAEEYSRRDKRVQVHSTPNQGVSAARNTGVALSSGQYIAFLDADDFWSPNKLALHLDLMEKDNSIGVSFSKIRFLTQTGEPSSTYSNGPFQEVQPAHLLYENPICTSSNITVRREVFADVGGFNESMSFAEDQEWLFRVLLRSNWKIKGLSQALVQYRASESGLSSELSRMEAGWEKMVSMTRDYASEFVDKHYARAKAIYLRYLARRALRLRISPKIAFNYLKRSLASDWTILWREPRRSILTLIGVSAYRLSQCH